MLAQSPSEVASRGLFDAPAGAGTVGTGRIAGLRLDRKGQHARSADNAVLDDLTLDLHLDHLASLREHCSRDPGAATSAGAGPRQRDDPALVGVIDQGASDTAS